MLDFSTNVLRAFGIGKAKSGTEHLREMKVSSLLLLILIPLFVFTFGSIVGESHADVTLYFEKPLPSLICALTIIVGFAHFKSGVTVAIEDYSRGTIAKLLISGVTALSYAGMAIGLFAIAKMVF
tara:strand:+ start:278 stop:652 length:375 start_codon:yes stop_codon:yes gene_type:complete